jgi:hypothetical protein
MLCSLTSLYDRKRQPGSSSVVIDARQRFSPTVFLIKGGSVPHNRVQGDTLDVNSLPELNPSISPNILQHPGTGGIGFLPRKNNWRVPFTFAVSRPTSHAATRGRKTTMQLLEGMAMLAVFDDSGFAKAPEGLVESHK